MIAFKQITTLQIIEGFNEAKDEITEQSTETFAPGEPVDAEIVSEDGPFVELQFGGGGGVAFTVPRDSFDILPDKKV